MLIVQDAPVDEGAFLDEWRLAVGDSLEESVSLSLLTVSQSHVFPRRAPLGSYRRPFLIDDIEGKLPLFC